MTNLKFHILLFVVMSLLVSCEKEKSTLPQEAHNQHGVFYRANSLKFYYIDENGNSLIDLNDTTSFPVTYIDTIELPVNYEQFGINGYIYNGNCDIVGNDGEIDKNYWETLIRGVYHQEEFHYYIKINENDIDTITAKFRFEEDVAYGVDGSYAYIDKLFYNSYLIMYDEGLTSEYEPESVFVKKLEDKTLISFNEE